MTATLYQKMGVEHVAGTNALDLDRLFASKYRVVTFQPQDSRSKQFIVNCKRRSEPMIGGLWFDDPQSHGSLLRGDPEGCAEDIVTIVRAHDLYREHREDKITGSPQIIILDIEFTGKGYPTWKANTNVKAWHRWTIEGWEWQTWGDGKTGVTKPSFLIGDTVKDGSIEWHRLGKATFDGWDWNEKFMTCMREKVIDGGLPTRPMIVQPMGHQADFNYGAYFKRRKYGTYNGKDQFSPQCRISPQCYDGSMVPADPVACVNEIVGNGYVKSHYGFNIPTEYIHPTLAPCNFPYYKSALETLGKRGYTIFRADYMNGSDYVDYKDYAYI